MSHPSNCACHGVGTRAQDGYCLHRFTYLDADGQGTVHHFCPTCHETWPYVLQRFSDPEVAAIRRAATAYRAERRVG